MNPLDLLSTIDDIRKDRHLTDSMIALIRIAREAATHTAAEHPANDIVGKGVASLHEALEVAANYLDKGKLPMSVKFSLAVKFRSISHNLEALGTIMEQEDHPVTRSFTAHVTGAAGFNDVLDQVWQKANGKMIQLTSAGSDGMDVTELLSGQNIRLCRLTPEQFGRMEKLLATPSSSSAPAKGLKAA